MTEHSVVTESPVVLVIEDDPDIALAIATVLRRGGLGVIRAADGRAGLREFHQRQPALVLLDVGLPVLDGWQVLERIRDLSDTPVLMLTAHGYEADKVRGLRAGADDYLAKPFGNAELLARIEALLRRAPGLAAQPGSPELSEAGGPPPEGGLTPEGGPPPEAGAPALEPVGGPPAGADGLTSAYDDGFLAVNPRSCEVSVAGRAASLTPTEFRLLGALVRHRGQVLSPSQLLELAWNDPGRVGPDRVKFSVLRLRRKLGLGSQEGSPIEAVRGFGYRYVPPAGPVSES